MSRNGAEAKSTSNGVLGNLPPEQGLIEPAYKAIRSAMPTWDRLSWRGVPEHRRRGVPERRQTPQHPLAKPDRLGSRDKARWSRAAPRPRPTKPFATPMPTRDRASRSTSDTISLFPAPNAIRTPISCVRVGLRCGPLGRRARHRRETCREGRWRQRRRRRGVAAGGRTAQRDQIQVEGAGRRLLDCVTDSSSHGLWRDGRLDKELGSPTPGGRRCREEQAPREVQIKSSRHPVLQNPLWE